MNRVFTCMKCIASPQRYKKELWFALVLSLACLSIGLWAKYQAKLTHFTQACAFYSVEGALTLSVLSLLWFAFSTYPQRSSVM